MGDRRPQLLALELARDLKSVARNGSGLAPSSPSNFGVGLVFPHLALSSRTFFFTLPLFLSNLEFVVSIDDALLLEDFPGLASGLIIHQELLPVPSFWTRTNRLCRDKLWRIEFFHPAELLLSPLSLKNGTFFTIQSYIWERVRRWSGALWMALVIKSAYDKFPQAFLREPFLLWDEGVDSSRFSPPSNGKTDLESGDSSKTEFGLRAWGSTGTGGPAALPGCGGVFDSRKSGLRSGHVHDRGRACGSNSGSMSTIMNVFPGCF